MPLFFKNPRQTFRRVAPVLPITPSAPRSADQESAVKIRCIVRARTTASGVKPGSLSQAHDCLEQGYRLDGSDAREPCATTRRGMAPSRRVPLLQAIVPLAERLPG